MESLTFILPGHIREALVLPENEQLKRVRLEVALSFYEQGILAFGKARELAECDRWSFSSHLKQRGIPLHYTEEELNEDIAYAHSQ